jgi:hypothetical protein
MAKQTLPEGHQEYIALVTISTNEGNERWLPGSRIVLDDFRASIHLAAGNIAPLEATVPPVVDVGPALVVHAPETEVST